MTKDEWNDPKVGRSPVIHDPEGKPVHPWQPPSE